MTHSGLQLPKQYKKQTQGVALRLVLVILLQTLIVQVTFAQESDSFRWFKVSSQWCVDVERSRFCFPFEVNPTSITPNSVALVQVVPENVVPNRFVFNHYGESSFAKLANSDEQVTVLESFEIPGASAKKVLIAGLSVLEIKLTNGVMVTLIGENYDELVDIAVVISSSWE